MSERDDAARLWTLHPDLVTYFNAAAPKLAEQFPDSRLGTAPASCFRPPAIQATANRVGASPFDGRRLFSNHQWFPSRAFDPAVFEAGAYITDGTDPRYTWLGEYAESLGLVWGARFVHPRPDPDHIELPSQRTPDHDEAARALAAYYRSLAARGVIA